MDKQPAYSNIDEYIALFPANIQALLQELRVVIHAEAPEAVEKIAYQMPTFYLHGNLVHFAAFKNHISLFPAPSGIEAFRDDLAIYATSKGTIQFPLGQPIPFDVVRRIVRFRVQENTTRAQAKRKK